MEQQQIKVESESDEGSAPAYVGVTLFPTKAGRGFKVIHDGQWFYASKQQVLDVINHRQKGCTFTAITDE